MNTRIRELARQADDGYTGNNGDDMGHALVGDDAIEKFAELIVRECINRRELLGAIARGWCNEKNSHKTMDTDLALAIFDEVERQIKQHFGVDA